MMEQRTVDAISADLASVGLNRCAAVLATGLPDDVWLQRPLSPRPTTGYSPTRRPTTQDTTLLLVGHGGTALWSHLTGDRQGASLHPGGDPIDTFSITATEAALDRHLGGVGRRLLYPHPDCPVDLVALGRLLGWQSASPLGLGIHPDWGLWSAFRALWELDTVDLSAQEASSITPTPDVCGDCRTQDCVSACPSGAVVVGQRFDLTACFGHRGLPDSSCAETCHARRACPVGVEHRYGDEQMAYHYRLSRPAAPVIHGEDSDSGPHKSSDRST